MCMVLLQPGMLPLPQWHSWLYLAAGKSCSCTSAGHRELHDLGKPALSVTGGGMALLAVFIDSLLQHRYISQKP